MTTPILISLLLVFPAAAAYQILAPHVIRYTFTPRHFAITVLGIPVITIPYDEIVDANEIGIWESITPSFALRFGNRVIGRIVRIRRRSGLFQSILITPDSPQYSSTIYSGDERTRALAHIGRETILLHAAGPLELTSACVSEASNRNAFWQWRISGRWKASRGSRRCGACASSHAGRSLRSSRWRAWWDWSG